MSALKFIKEFLYLDLPDNQNTEQSNKTQYIHILCWAGIIIFPILIIFNLIEEEYPNAIIFLISFLISVYNAYLIRSEQWKDYHLHIFVITISILFLFFYFTGSNAPLGQFAIVAYPLIAISLYNKKTGSILSLIILILCIGVSFVPGEWNANYNTDLTFKAKLFVLYVCIFIYCYGFVTYINKNKKTLDEELNRLSGELKIKEDFISKLSHQIRTPLNNIMVTSNLFTDTKIDEQQKDLIETIMASTNNLVNVVNNISKVSAIDLGHQTTKIVFNLQSTLNNTIKLFQSLNNNRVSITLKSASNLHYNLLGDPVKLKQIFLNIVENIIRNSSEQNIKITISYLVIKESEKTTELSFKIETDVKLKINLSKIDTFGGYSEIDEEGGDPTNPETFYYDFTIAKKIIEHSGSQLLVDSPTNSTIFSFFLIYDISDIQNSVVETIESATIAYSKKDIESKPIDLKEANILLVEDNLINQKIVILSIQKLVKNIDVANNGKEALDKFGTSKYDLILMDIQMPVMDGIIATKKIREIESSTNYNTPIIAITANALAGDKENCLAAGMNDYISKPFQPEALITKMKNLVGRE
jgi:CheY-like chemotaxis protein/signal transduction histidine kinase